MQKMLHDRMINSNKKSSALCPDWFQLATAAACIRDGGVVAHATEGLWGLTCSPFDAKAVGRILELKRRKPEQGLILIGANSEMFSDQLCVLQNSVKDAILASWPGAHTWLVPDASFPPWVSGWRTSIAVRVPGHAQARQLCALVGHPIISTSANVAGRAPAESLLMARRLFGMKVDFYLAGQTCSARAGTPSTITDALSFQSHRA